MTKIQLKRSSALTSGSARVPTSGQLDYGELAVNYNSSDPQLFFKDSAGSVVSFFDKYAALDGATFTGDVAFSANVDFDGAVTIKGDSTNGSGKLSLTCEQNTHTVNIKAPAHSSAANYTLTLPSSAGTSTQVLTTDGSGNLSWAVSSMSTADKNKLDGIETGATADQTAAEILTAIKTVDGSGSGLDADLLDGIQASSFLRSDADDQTTGQLTADTLLLTNDATDTARHRVAVYGSGTSSTSYGMMLWNSNGTSGDWATMIYGPNQSNRRISFGKINDSTFTNHADVTQIAHFDLDDSTLRLTADAYVNNSKVWHVGNDGSGSGLDADTLDGVQGSNYLRSDVEDQATIINIAGELSPNSSAKLQVYGFSRMGPIMLATGTASTTSFTTTNERWILNDGSHVYASTASGSYNNRIWTDSNDGAGSGLDADNLDGYTWDSAGKVVRGSDVYADSWLRNYNNASGLYNQANDAHFYSTGYNYWHINGNSNDITHGGLIFYDRYQSSAGNSTGRKGYVYWDSNGYGLLGAAGQWAVNIRSTGTDVIFGGHTTNNHYNSISSARVSFGGGNDFANYHLGTNSENYGGTYTKLDLRWHTGIRMGAQLQYGGIRLYDTEDLGTVRWHFEGPSSYTYKYVWLNTSTNCFYSDTNSWHIEPNTQTSYASMNIRGVRNGWYGISFHEADNDPHLMFDNVGSGRGGLYWQGGGRWALFYDHADNSLGICASTTSSSYQLYVTGNVYATGNITAYSDARKKTNIKTIKSALNKVLDLRGVTYNKINIDKTISDKTEIGVIAQEVEKVVPEVVTYAEDVDQYGVSYGNLAGLFIEAIKELKIELNELKASLA